MIKKVVLTKFKRFTDTTVELLPNSLSVVVGGNNSGKSSLLQALASWNYAKSVIIFYKQRIALNSNSHRDGVGISFEDFTPLNIPSFDYLWTNLNSTGGYTLKISVFWDDNQNQEKYLEISFALTQDRLYVKKTDSNLTTNDNIPEVAYLPPFAGISEKEPWLSVADRRKQIGRGLSGSVLRNLIYDFHNEHVRQLEEIGQLPPRTRTREREIRLANDKFNKLNEVLADVFGLNLYPEKFSLEFHNYLKVPLKKGRIQNGIFQPYPNYNARDIMAEGRGFLQWLSSFCLLLDDRINVLLLDEPDAHLHTTLQVELIKRLTNYTQQSQKQILVATHSSEVTKSISANMVLHVNGNSAEYCRTETQLKSLLLGLGVEHFPLLYKIQTNKKVVFVEGEFDKSIITDFAVKIETPIPTTVVFWPMANNHKERKQVYLHLKTEIPDIKIISLEDKDNGDYTTTQRNLTDLLFADTREGNSAFLARKWRRWELESYLINPHAIAACSGKSEDEIKEDLANEFGMIWPNDHNSSDRTNTNGSLFDRDGKSIIEWFENRYGFTKYKIACHYKIDEVPDDIKELVRQINAL